MFFHLFPIQLQVDTTRILLLNQRSTMPPKLGLCTRRWALRTAIRVSRRRRR